MAQALSEEREVQTQSVPTVSVRSRMGSRVRGGLDFRLGTEITLLGCVLPATVFLVCWRSIRGDVQGATGVAALLISYYVLLTTMVASFAVA